MQLEINKILCSTATHTTVAVDSKDGIVEIVTPASLFNGEAIFVTGVIERIENLAYVRLPVETTTGMNRIWVKQTLLKE